MYLDGSSGAAAVEVGGVRCKTLQIQIKYPDGIDVIELCE